MSRARKEKGPPRELSELEVAERLRNALGVDLDSLLSDPTNKDATRHFGSAVAKWALAQAAARAVTPEGEVVPYFFGQIPRLLEADAKVTGTLGEKEVRLPLDEVAALCQLLELPKKDAELLAKAILGREEKVIASRSSG